MKTNQRIEPRVRFVGRTLRLVTGLALVWITYSVMRSNDTSFNLRVVSVVLGLAIFYSGIHFVINKYAVNLNRWTGAFLAVAIVALLFIFGGSLGQVASVAYIGISLVLQVVRGDGGCEVMSIPGLLFGRRTHLVCIAFSPIDWIEEIVANRHKTSDN